MEKYRLVSIIQKKKEKNLLYSVFPASKPLVQSSELRLTQSAVWPTTNDAWAMKPPFQGHPACWRMGRKIFLQCWRYSVLALRRRAWTPPCGEDFPSWGQGPAAHFLLPALPTHHDDSRLRAPAAYMCSGVSLVTQVSLQLWRLVGCSWVVFHQITQIEACLPTSDVGTEKWVFTHKPSAFHSRALEFPRDPPKNITFRTQGLLSEPGQLAAPTRSPRSTL